MSVKDEFTCTVLDRVTGETRDHTDYWWQWIGSQMACDCGRSELFGHSAGADGECAGTARYVVIATTSPVFSLAELNQGYAAK